jgi:hypothetical protein
MRLDLLVLLPVERGILDRLGFEASGLLQLAFERHMRCDEQLLQSQSDKVVSALVVCVALRDLMLQELVVSLLLLCEPDHFIFVLGKLIQYLQQVVLVD